MIPWLTVITTPSRRDYLDRTLASLEHAGAATFPGERIIFVDGDARSYNYPGWRTCQVAPVPLGVKATMFSILGSAAHANVPFVVYTEDDVEYCYNALPAILQIPVPRDCGFLTFCDIKHIGQRDGITVVPGFDASAPINETGHWGNQCLIIPRPSLQRLLTTTLDPPDWTPPNIASDLQLGRSFGHYGVFYPSLAEHIGVRSAVQPVQVKHEGRGRVTASFAGVGFDAMTLPRLSDPMVYRKRKASA